MELVEPFAAALNLKTRRPKSRIGEIHIEIGKNRHPVKRVNRCPPNQTGK
jgi:hypothetical protein